LEYEVFEMLMIFLQNLRYENMHRKNQVHLESLEKEKRKFDGMKDDFECLKRKLDSQDRNMLEIYLEQAKTVAFEEQQETYCQGIADCIQMLAGLGLLTLNDNIKKAVEDLKDGPCD